jgi:hypothetical protein
MRAKDGFLVDIHIIYSFRKSSGSEGNTCKQNREIPFLSRYGILTLCTDFA